MRLRTLLVLSALFPSAVWAQSSPDAEFCAGSAGTVSERQAACSRAIASGQLSERNVAITYNNRGNKWRDQGDPDSAIADYNEAIRLDPRFPQAYLNRGGAERGKGEYDRAIADYNEAIRLDPQYALAIISRGAAEYLAGRLDAAAADLAAAGRMSAEYRSYAAIWSYLTGERAGRRDAAASELQAAYAGLDQKAWPAPVVELMLGRNTPDAVLKAAQAPDARTRRDQACEANFYVGTHQLSRGSRAEALARLQEAREGCPKDFIEYDAAVAELKRLEGAK
jgi:lipoprotein NlpI